MSQLPAVVFFAIGIFLLIFGFNASDSAFDRISEAFTGRFTDSTMLYLGLGLASVVVGLVLLIPRRRT